MRAISAIGLTMLAMLALAPCPAAAAAITYDVSATLDHGPTGDLGNTAASLTLFGGGLVTLVTQFRARRRASARRGC